MQSPVPSYTPPPLDEQVAALWPLVDSRLGERRAAFFDAARAQALAHGLDNPCWQARYLNLCFAFGPAFEDKAGHEWAKALLLNQRLAPWARLHQLVQAAVAELKRRGGDEQTLRAADNALLDLIDRQPRASDAEAQPVARQACDLEALGLRLVDTAWRHEYSRVNHAWQRQPFTPPAPALRIDAGHPPPSRLCVLAHADGEGPAAGLQVRQLVHGHCGLGQHPGLRWLGAHGLAWWQGHEATALTLQVRAQASPAPPAGLGTPLLAETAADLTLLEATTCALRDEGLTVGAQHLQLWAWPAQQWLFELRRDVRHELVWPRTAAGPTVQADANQCRLERDGAGVDAPGWQAGFGQALPAALDAGLERLWLAWQKTVSSATLRASTGLFNGDAGLTWGWREGPQGLAGDPVLRVQAALALRLCLDWVLEGELELAGARSRVRLSAKIDQPLQARIQRDQHEPPLADAMAGAVQRFECPLVLEFDPLANAQGVLWRDAGACTGQITGEFGLRPNPAGGATWQWYAKLTLAPVAVPWVVHDPVLGQTSGQQALLPALTLLDWCLG